MWAHAVCHITSHCGSWLALWKRSFRSFHRNELGPKLFPVQTSFFDVPPNNAGCDKLALPHPGANIRCRAVRDGNLHKSNVLPRASIGSHPFARLQPSPRDRLIGDLAQLRRQDTWRHRCRQTGDSAVISRSNGAAANHWSSPHKAPGTRPRLRRRGRLSAMETVGGRS